MTADNIKSASEKMASMSDAELQNMAKLAGFNISPEILKTSANMMKNMDPQELERMKNLAGSFNAPSSSSSPPSSSYPPPPSSYPPSSSYSPPPPSSSSFPPPPSLGPSSSFPKIESLKKKGNDLFSKGNYEEAGTVYFEAILEIEEIKAGDGWKEEEELKTLEVACRLNYAVSKSKLEEWDVVLTQGKEVLKLGENGKARFRVGQALSHLGKNEAAMGHLEKARELMSNDPIGTLLI